MVQGGNWHDTISVGIVYRFMNHVHGNVLGDVASSSTQDMKLYG